MNAGFLIIIAAMIIGMIARSKANGTYRKFSKVSTGRGLSGVVVARQILDNYGLANIGIEEISGHLTDHYDSRSSTLRLSQNVYSGTSIASVGVAAHEAGQVAGKLYFVSTMGSALGTLATSFYFVLWFEINTILTLLTAALLVMAAVSVLVHKLGDIE